MSSNARDPLAKEQWMAGLLSGWKKRLPASLTVLVVNDVEVTRERVGEELADTLAACEEVRAMRHALARAIKKRDEKLARREKLATSVEQLVRVVHGENGEALGDYGLAPRKKHVPTTTELTVAVVRRLATRQKNGTLGVRQRRRLAAPQVHVIDADGRDMLEAAKEARPDPIEGIVITEVPPAPPREPPRLTAESDEPTKR